MKKRWFWNGMFFASGALLCGACVWLMPRSEGSVQFVRHDPGQSKVELPAPIQADLDHIDPALEGKRIQITGKLTWPNTVRDPLTGMAHPGQMERRVEVYGWTRRASCGLEGAPSYDKLDWVTHPRLAPADVGREDILDEPPEDMNWNDRKIATRPFENASFSSGDFQVGAYRISPWTFPIKQPLIELGKLGEKALPPELLERFPEAEVQDYFVYLHGHHAPPRYGDVRISYAGPEEIPNTTFVITGYQKDDQITYGVPLEELVELRMDDPDYDLFNVTVEPIATSKH